MPRRRWSSLGSCNRTWPSSTSGCRSGGGAEGASFLRLFAEDTKIIVYSGDDDPATVLRLIEAGARSYLVEARRRRRGHRGHQGRGRRRCAPVSRDQHRARR